MKKLFAFLLFFSFLTHQAQILDPVKWQTKVEKISETEFNLIFEGKIDAGWHMYSQFTPDGGPLPTELKFTKGNYDLVGKTQESKTKTEFNDVFGINETFFENNVTLTQKIKVTNTNIKPIKVVVEYQVCKNSCINQDKTFEFQIPNSNIIQNKTENGVLPVPNDIKKTQPDTVINTSVDENVIKKVSTNSEEKNNKANILLYGLTENNFKKLEISSSKTSTITDSKKSLWNIFVLGFLGGLLALLTPCVFPMIPLTVSFFTKSNGKKTSGGLWKALLYGFFILAVYLILSIPFHLLDSINPDILNEISTNVWLNIIFFIIFIFFAFSFFGFYELTLPSSWTNKTTQGENIGGILGIFFMALTLAIVSFSCTGPILGSLLAGSLTADGGAWQLTAGMGGFGFALGLPFALFAMFPNMLNSLPKSGGWLTTTKVVLGFLELALAMKFLSNADLVKHWGILKYEPFLILWIIIFTGLTVYLFGKIKFPHDSPIQKLSKFRIVFAIAVAAFTIYLVSGFSINKETKTYNSLSLLSGLAPPVGYSYLYPNDCPNNLNCFKDLKTGLQYAKDNNKPVLIDFSGYACVNCRKMEENIWSQATIDKILRNDIVLISLYVDDKKELSKEEQIEVNRINGGSRILENYGHKWAHFQTAYFQSNSQPYYVILNPKTNEILNEPISYTPNVVEYKTWLENGIFNFKK